MKEPLPHIIRRSRVNLPLLANYWQVSQAVNKPGESTNASITHQTIQYASSPPTKDISLILDYSLLKR